MKRVLILVAGLGALALGQVGCEAETCAEPVECVRSCDGPVEFSGCDPCPAGTFVRTSCQGQQDGGQQDGGFATDGGDGGFPSDGGDGGL